MPSTAKLLAGGDYTLMVYLDGRATPVAQIIEDNNTAPVLSQGVKFRLINLASNNQGLQLSLSVNSQSVASLVAYGTASDYFGTVDAAEPRTRSSKCSTARRCSSR